MYSSGTTGVSANSASPATLIAIPAGATYNRLLVVNEGSVAGFFSVDGGTVWGRIPAASAATAPGIIEWMGRSNSSPQLKSGSTASSMSAVFAFADEVKL